MSVTTRTPTTASASRFAAAAQIEGDVAFVTLTGELDHHAAGHFRSVVADALGAGATSVVLACSELSFLDSGGVAALVDLQSETGRQGGSLTLRNPRVIVERVLTVVGLDGLIAT